MARDHVNHPYAMNSGSWGGTKGFLKGKKISSLIEEFVDKIGYGADIGLLMNKIWPIVSNDIMSHDAFYCVKYNGKPFPTKRDDNWQHVGHVFDANDKPIQRHFMKLKYGNPAECRPEDRHNWIIWLINTGNKVSASIKWLRNNSIKVSGVINTS